MRHLLQDVRHTLRRLRSSPGFTAAAVLTLGLGIGAGTAVFSVVHGVLLRALPVPEPERLVYITRSGDVSIPDGVDWRAATPALDSLALFLRDWSFDLVGSGEPERLSGYVVEPEYFQILGVPPLLGRALGAEDNQPGGPRVAVISENLWRRRFASDPSILGRSLRLSDHPTAIVGVMPERLDVLGDRAELWVPVAVETPWALKERGTNNFDAIGKLHAGATLEAAQTELKAVCERLAGEYPRTNRGKIVRPILLLDFLVGGVRRGLWVLFGAVALVLLIACANLASLLLARAATRRPEIALRSALGAGRGRIARLMLVESLLLAGLGGALGILLAALGGPALLALAPAALPRASSVTLDLPVLAFGAGLAILCGVLCGFAPTWRTLRVAPAAVLREGGRGAAGSAGARRSRDLVIAAEVALAFLLLLGAQLLGRSFLRLSAVPLGFDPSGVLTAELVLPEARYSEHDRQTQAFRGVVAELRGVPGVVAASSVIGAPLRPSGRGIGSGLEVSGFEPVDGRPPSAMVRPVMGDYFRALQVPVLRGRELADADDERAAPVVVVNQRFVATYWPGQDAVGKRVRFSGWDTAATPGVFDTRWFTVVGVVADTKPAELESDDTRSVYLPYAQRGPAWQRFGTLVVRSAGDPETLRHAVLEAVWRVDPSLTLSGVETLKWRQKQSAAQPRFLAEVLGAFALAALLLVAQGVFGLLAYAVAVRRREIGVRIVLGASSRRVVSAIVGRGLAAVLAGALTGVAGGLALRRVLAGVLYEVRPDDPWALLGSLSLLLLIALAASAVPAWRAARIDPAAALRQD